MKGRTRSDGLRNEGIRNELRIESTRPGIIRIKYAFGMIRNRLQKNLSDFLPACNGEVVSPRKRW